MAPVSYIGEPAPAPFPSILRTSGQSLVDAHDYTVPLMRGFCAQVVPWKASDFAAMAAKGARIIRVVVFWDKLEPAPGSISATFAAYLDLTVARCVAAGMYVVFTLYFGPNGRHMPAWAQTNPGLRASAMSNYVANAQRATQYVAQRYGDPSDPLGAGQYTPAVIGMGLNEITPDSTTGPAWLTTLISQQVASMVTWMRACAPDWIAFLCAGFGAFAPVPNAPGSGQTAQTFNAAPAAPTTNFVLEVHDYQLATTGPPDFDGRRPNGGTHIVERGGTQIKVGDTTNAGGNNFTTYPPVVGGVTLDRATCQSQLAAFFAPYVAYCAPGYANCPLVIGETGWVPVDGTTHFSGAELLAADKRAVWAAAGPVIEMQWDFGKNQAQNRFAACPGAGAPGADSDGWQIWTNAMFAE